MTNQVHELDNHPRRQNQRIVDDAQFLAELRAMGPTAEVVLTEMLNNMEREIALMEYVSGLLPELACMHYPALLALLNREEDAIELAVLLARESLMEDGEDTTQENISRLVFERYLTPALAKAIVNRDQALF